MTGPHLDEETLSAALDGEAGLVETNHLASCERCRAELEALHAVARAVGSPVGSPSAAAIDDAIARALQETAGVIPAERSSPPHPPSPAPTSMPPPAAPLGRPGWSRLWTVPAAGVAVAIVVVGVVIALRSASPRARSTTAEAPVNAPAASNAGASTTTLRPAAVPGPLASGVADLGPESDAAVVARQVVAALGAAKAASAAPAPNGAFATAGSASAIDGTFCLPAAAIAAGVPAATPSLFVARLEWRGQPAEVVVFSRPGGLAGVIVSAPGCSLLAGLPF